MVIGDVITNNTGKDSKTFCTVSVFRAFSKSFHVIDLLSFPVVVFLQFNFSYISAIG